MFQLRVVSLCVTAMSRLFLTDPTKFISQVGERLNIGVLKNVDNAVKKGLGSRRAGRARKAQELSSRGEYSQARAFASGRERKRLVEELETLTTRGLRTATLSSRGPLPAAADGSGGSGLPITSLHFLTNSLPHTQSGYSLRSHAVLRSIKNSGIGVRATTRLGYPVTVGKLPKTPVDLIEGIPYERLLPGVYPNGLTARLEKSVELLYEIGKREGVDLLHTTTDFRNGIVVHSAAEKLGIPWVYEVRGEMEKTWLSRIASEKQADAEQSEFYRLSRAQEARVARSAHGVVALSEISKQQLVERGVEESRITVVPNAVDDEHLTRKINKDALRRELGLPSGLLIGAITAVVGYEGLDDLIRSLTHLPSDATVLIVGDGTARPELERLAKSLGYSDRVIFAGRQAPDIIWKWYGALDIFVVPRKNTAVARTVTPIKPLIALALGVPVVTSDLPALREVTGNIASYAVAEDPESLAEASLAALDIDTEVSRDFAATRTWSANAQAYRDLYLRIVAENSLLN